MVLFSSSFECVDFPFCLFLSILYQRRPPCVWLCVPLSPRILIYRTPELRGVFIFAKHHSWLRGSGDHLKQDARPKALVGGDHRHNNNRTAPRREPMSLGSDQQGLSHWPCHDYKSRVTHTSVKWRGIQRPKRSEDLHVFAFMEASLVCTNGLWSLIYDSVCGIRTMPEPFSPLVPNFMEADCLVCQRSSHTRLHSNLNQMGGWVDGA